MNHIDCDPCNRVMNRHIHCTNKFHILENSSHDTEYKHAGKIVHMTQNINMQVK